MSPDLVSTLTPKALVPAVRCHAHQHHRQQNLDVTPTGDHVPNRLPPHTCTAAAPTMARWHRGALAPGREGGKQPGFLGCAALTPRLWNGRVTLIHSQSLNIFKMLAWQPWTSDDLAVILWSQRVMRAGLEDEGMLATATWISSPFWDQGTGSLPLARQQSTEKYRHVS